MELLFRYSRIFLSEMGGQVGKSAYSMGGVVATVHVRTMGEGGKTAIFVCTFSLNYPFSVHKQKT